jgi:glycosyltransferase involved in cell wall biosynthesis
MISVVTITFNNYDELVQTTRSVEGLPVEHIIINGGNCEKTAEFLKSFTGIQLTEKDHGISDAFNKGIKLASGKGIVFLNSGDLLVDQQYLAWADQALEAADFTYSNVIFHDQLAGPLLIKPTKSPLGRGMPFPHQSMVVKREIFKELGGFKLEYKRAMCFEFTCRLIKAGKNGTYFNQATMKVDGGGISASQEGHTILESKKAMVENSVFNLKNRYFFAIRKFGFTARNALLFLGFESVLRLLKRLKRRLL